MNVQKIIAATEAFLAELKAANAEAHVAQGNRTRAITSYDGSDPVQNVVDCLRRAIRVSRTGHNLSKKERNVMRKAIKELKGDESILNTNGNDYLTQHGV